ncbi:hypothetical protein PHAMO_80048 [Magnetospirillum molischianum DSM 120]|uniref:Uncharacterized protein n=1 Tax=Magnetospirillum molischianum DSM 120 TaxID=1150626 RepID=H8FY19_MAGML|nr:hypothetical protein PHAMO_80048 [Magnetospirillum molischianum DSM 120]
MPQLHHSSVDAVEHRQVLWGDSSLVHRQPPVLSFVKLGECELGSGRSRGLRACIRIVCAPAGRFYKVGRWRGRHTGGMAMPGRENL